MITKAIVEEIVSPYQVKVRVPTLDRNSSSPLSTNSDNLNVATICSLPHCYINVQVGDVVFIAFEDNTYYRAVILGHLSREAMTNSYADVTFGNLTALASAQLPKDTYIGEVTSKDINCLVGVTANIQKQLDSLKEQINQITELLQGGNA